MPRSIDYRATSAHPASKVYAAMVDRDLLEEQLRHIGGPGAGGIAPRARRERLAIAPEVREHRRQIGRVVLEHVRGNGHDRHGRGRHEPPLLKA